MKIIVGCKLASPLNSIFEHGWCKGYTTSTEIGLPKVRQNLDKVKPCQYQLECRFNIVARKLKILALQQKKERYLWSEYDE